MTREQIRKTRQLIRSYEKIRKIDPSFTTELKRRESVMRCFLSEEKIFQHCISRNWDWVETTNPEWDWNNYDYEVYYLVPRIPFDFETFPRGLVWLRSFGSEGYRLVTTVGEKGISYSQGFEVVHQTWDRLQEFFLWSRDLVKWNRCETEEINKTTTE